MSMRFWNLLPAAWLGVLCVSAASCTWTYRPVPSDTYIGPPRPAAPEPGAEKGPAKGPGKAPAPVPQAPEKAPAAGGPVEVDVQEAILMAVEHNQALVVERLTPQITRTFEDQQAAVFDPVLSGTASNGRASTVQQLPSIGQNPAFAGPIIANQVFGQLACAQFLPTGTAVALTAGTTGSDLSARHVQVQTRLGMSVTQSLLRGFGTDVNLATLRQARIDTLASEYELRGFAESLVDQVEEAYWDYALAQKQVGILKAALALAEKQLSDTNAKIEVGKMPLTERAAALAQVAVRRSGLIDGLSNQDKARLLLVRLLNPQGGQQMWKRDVISRQPPVPPTMPLEDVEAHVQVALRMRPDLNQARLQVARGDLEIVKTKNGLLPQLDLFITLGKSGYADSFGGSWREIHESGYDILFGLGASYPLENRDARARHQRATLTRHQALEAVDNLAQLIQVDVRTAYLEVQRAREQIEATAASRKYAQEALTAEEEKLAAGRSTVLLVATAEQNLVAAQLAEVAAVVAELKAFTALYRLEGSLLARRGIIAPGREPAELPAAPARGFP